MQVYVINLARRPDRLNAMEAQFEALGLPFTRVSAIDAKETDDASIDRHFTPGGPIGALPKGDKCCLLSHVRAWSQFAASGEPYGVIMEDDIVLDRAAKEFLGSSDWIPPSIGLLKVEHYGPQGQRVLLGEPIGVGQGRTVARIWSKYTGAGAYIVRRDVAKRLLGQKAKWSVSVDHALFNANVSSLADELEPFQLLPVLARQSEAVGGATDIGPWRAAQREMSTALLKREVMRAYYDIRLLPRQISLVVRGRVRFVPIRSDAMVPATSQATA